jgi:hypothetical protein
MQKNVETVMAYNPKFGTYEKHKNLTQIYWYASYYITTLSQQHRLYKIECKNVRELQILKEAVWTLTIYSGRLDSDVDVNQELSTLVPESNPGPPEPF